MRKKERDDERQVIQKKNEEEMRHMKRKYEDDKKSWQVKYIIKVEVIEVLQQKLSIQSKSLTDALKIAKKESMRKAGLGAAQGAQRKFQITIA